jgi:hypothetical protein
MAERLHHRRMAQTETEGPHVTSLICLGQNVLGSKEFPKKFTP